MDIDGIRLLFNQFKLANEYILNKRNCNKKLSFLDRYIFQATSFSMSMIMNNLFVSTNNILRCYMNRCLIETIALINMFEAGDMPENIDDIMEHISAINDKLIYDEVESEEPELKRKGYKVFKEYQKSIKWFTEKSGLKHVENEQKITKLVINFKYNSKISKYFKELSKEYYELSNIIHPCNLSILNDNIVKFDLPKIEEICFSKLNSFIESHYKSQLNESNKYDFDYYFNGFTDQLSPMILYLKTARLQSHILDELSKYADAFILQDEEKVLINQFKACLFSLAIDELLDLDEVIICKFKPFIEMYGPIYTLLQCFINNDKKLDDKLALYKIGSMIKTCTNINDFDNNKIIEFYNSYCSVYGNKYSKDEFVSKIEEKQIIKLIDYKISDNIKTILDKIDAEGENDDIHSNSVYRIAVNYSHANGYVLKSLYYRYTLTHPIVMLIRKIIYFHLIDYQIIVSKNKSKEYEQTAFYELIDLAKKYEFNENINNNFYHILQKNKRN